MRLMDTTMTMCKYILLLAILVATTQIHTQSFGSQNAQWVYDFNRMGGPGVTKYKIDGDTTINGVTYQRMQKVAIREKSNGEIVHYPRIPFYLRQDNGIVLYTGDFTFEDTLFNFDAGIGDSWTLPSRRNNDDDFFFKYSVVDTFQVNFNGVPVLSQAIEIVNSSSPTIFKDTLIKDIGSRNELIVLFDWPPADIEGGDRGVLRCFSNDALGVVDFVPFHESGPYPFNLSDFEYYCDALSSTEETPSNSSFSVYPNPSYDYLTIASSEQRIDQIAIYNLNGALVNSFEPDHTQYELDVSQLPAGVYVIQINKTIFEKVIILE